ncbi:hypothetical protein Trydic_g12772 [Trypoxylus dichotomus]
MHLRKLATLLTEYFPEGTNDFSRIWVLNLFSEYVFAAAKLPVEIHDQLIEMSADKTIQLTSKDLRDRDVESLVSPLRTRNTAEFVRSGVRPLTPVELELPAGRHHASSLCESGAGAAGKVERRAPPPMRFPVTSSPWQHPDDGGKVGSAAACSVDRSAHLRVGALPLDGSGH